MPISMINKVFPFDAQWFKITPVGTIRLGDLRESALCDSHSKSV
jgi:hypothetical protein